MKSRYHSNRESKWEIISEFQLVSVILCLMVAIFIGCLREQKIGPLNVLLLVVFLSASFYIAIFPIRRIRINNLASITDPRIWMPISFAVYLLAYPVISIVFDARYSSYKYLVPQIILATSLGIISLQLGLHSVKQRVSTRGNRIKLDRYSPLIVLFLALVIHLYWWFWRIKSGYFFTHAAAYIPEVNIETGIRDILGKASLFIPSCILAFICKKKLWNKKICFCSFALYSFLIGILFLLSGAIRDFFWFFLLTLALLLYLIHPRKVKSLFLGVVILLVVIASIALVYSMRQISSRIYKSDRQLSYIVTNIDSVVSEGYRSGWVKETPIDRIFMTNEFFYQTIRAINENGSFGYGTYTFSTVPIVVPRLLWPKKGIVTDTEQIIQRKVLKVFEYDAGLTPLTQFYAEGGLIGVILGFFFLGLVASGTHRICFSINIGISGLIFWVVILGSVIQWEGNLPIRLLTGVRNGFVYALFTYAVSLFFQNKIRLDFM